MFDWNKVFDTNLILKMAANDVYFFLEKFVVLLT